MEETSIPFGAWLKRQRRALDHTQEELAQLIGCALVTLRKIEAGERRPSKQILERLTAILTIPPDERPAFAAYARAVFPDKTPPLTPPASGTLMDSPWQPPAQHTRTSNLPIQLTSFVGREHEMAEVERLLVQTRLLTLTGSGGSGKTRLALQVAGGLVSEFEHGVWWVDLARLADPSLVPQAVTEALGLRDEAQRPLLDQLADYFKPRNLLLMLDNCEHIIAACATFADAFLRVAPGLKILATSREPLSIAGEITYRVPSLQVPDPGRLPPLASLVEYEAVQLFAERGAAALPGFEPTVANGSFIAEVCYRLDGIPLAIELAAARVKVLPVEDICARLDDRFRLLTGGSRLALQRHQTLRATMDWSYSLLAEAERVLLRRLAVFAGGWTLEAAEAACGPLDGGAEVLDVLAGLVDKSLVVMGWRGRPGRCGMLETVRQYALERLEESGEEAFMGQQHAGYFLALAERAEPKLFSPEQNTWLARLEDEHSNLRAAHAWLRESGPAEADLRLAGALWRFWEVRGYLAEGQAWLSEALREAAAPEGQDVHAAARAKALLGAGVCAYYQRDQASAAGQLAESLELCRRLGDRQGIARARFYLGWQANDRGDFAEARTLFQECAAIFREIGDRQGLGWSLARLGLVDYWEGDAAAGRPLVEQGLALSREVDDRLGTAWWLEMLAMTLFDLGEFSQVEALAQEGVTRCIELGDRRDLAGCLGILGCVAAEMGDFKTAHVHLRECLVLASELGDKLMTAGAFYWRAYLSACQSQPALTLQLGGAAAALAEACEIVFPKAGWDKFTAIIEEAYRTLGVEAASAAWKQGHDVPLEQAIAEALGA